MGVIFKETSWKIQGRKIYTKNLRPLYKHVSFHCTSEMFSYLHIEHKAFHQQKDYDAFYHHECFLVCSLEMNPQYLRGTPIQQFIVLT